MNERNAMRLALACSVLGIILLFLFSSWAEQSSAPANIGELSMDDVGLGLKVCGNVTATRISNGHVFFSISDDTGSVRAVAFNNSAAKIRQAGHDFNVSSLCVAGQVEEYPPGSGDLEIVVERVVV